MQWQFFLIPNGTISLAISEHNALHLQWESGLHSSSWKEGPVVGSCKCGNEPSGVLKGGEFGYLFKKDCASWRKLTHDRNMFNCFLEVIYTVLYSLKNISELDIPNQLSDIRGFYVTVLKVK